MPAGLGLALLVAIPILLIVVVWRRPHPNHVFLFSMCAWLASQDPNQFTIVSSGRNRPVTTPRYKRA